MNMVLIEFAIVNILLIIAMFCEKRTGNIPSDIGWIGCISGLICSLIGEAICSWKEDLIAFVVSYIAIMIIHMAFSNMFGGGILKMIAMTAAFFGRYTLIVFIVSIIGLFAFVVIIEILIKFIPFLSNRYHSKHILAMPFVLIGSITTSALIYFAF